MQSIHGIMGSPEPNWISQVRPPPDCKYTHSTTPGLRVIGCRVAVPRSHWSAVPTPLFIYISQLLRDSFSVSQQPPSGNLLPIIPCTEPSLGRHFSTAEFHYQTFNPNIMTYPHPPAHLRAACCGPLRITSLESCSLPTTAVMLYSCTTRQSSSCLVNQCQKCQNTAD